MKKYKHPKVSVKRNYDNSKKLKESSKHKTPKWAEQTCACGYDVTLPWWCPYLVTIVTMVIRVNYVISPRSWWILHPDEVYQSVEVAFSEMSGYGFRSYEYLPAPSNTSIPMETQLLTSGMFALRSFVLPYIFTMATSIARLAGVTCSTFMIGRVFSAIVTSTLPLAVYKLVYAIFRCRLVALLSCALAASSVHLAVFGTHPLVNSFTAPFVVFGLYLCLDAKSKENACVHGDCLTDTQGKSCSDMNGNVLKTNQTFHNRVDIGSHVTITDRAGVVVKGESSTVTAPSIRKSKPADQTANTADMEPSSDTHRSTMTMWSCLKPYLGGAIIGCVSFIRPDVFMFIAILYLPLTIGMETTWSYKFRTFVTMTSGAISSVIICIADDFHQYGNFVFSPVQWFNFNVLSQKASLIFSTENSNTYTDMILLDQIGLFLNICAIIILILMPFIKTLRMPNSRLFYTLLISHVFLLLIYSFIGHKEPRIIHNSFILQAIVSAITIHYVTTVLQRLGVKPVYLTRTIFICVILSAILSYRNFPSIENQTASDWSYKDAEQSRDINMCLNFIRSQNDVKGVMVNGSVYNFGGFSVLEHDVPILVQVHYEYHLYEAKHQNRLGENNRIRVFTDFSDFIDIENQPYLRKVIRDNNLNYIITHTVNEYQMKYIGYENMFTFGTHSVLRRRHMSATKETVVSPETIKSATILEYEANWLITNALYSKAIWRIKTALDVNRKLRQRSRVRLFQLLMTCYGKMKQWNAVKVYQDECFSIYGRDTCVNQQEKIVRHNEYRRFT